VDPKLYERLFEAIETKFGTAPRFVRSEDAPNSGTESAVLVIIETEVGDAAAEVPGRAPRRATQKAVDRLLGDLEAELVRESTLDVSSLAGFLQD
jgi:hypothetical protein